MILLRCITLALLVLVCVPAMRTQSLQTESSVKTVELTFTTIDVPGTGFTYVAGINTVGDMVGYYGVDSNAAKHAFLYRDGIFTFIDYPGADSTFAYGINDAGLIVGSAEFNGGLTATGFLYDGSKFTPFEVPNRPFTIGYGINNAGDVVGTAGSPGAGVRAFVRRNNRFRWLDLPGHASTETARGINNFGQIAAYAIDGIDRYDGYIYKRGQLKRLAFPGAALTVAEGVNDQGITVGWYGSGSQYYGFAYKNGKYISFGYPGASFTEAAGVDSARQIVGSYTLDYETWHGFITSPFTGAYFDQSAGGRVSATQASR